MKKTLLISAALCMAVAGNAFAEQPAAKEYRQILKSGNFLLEYEDIYYYNSGKKMEFSYRNTLAAKNDMRMKNAALNGRGVLKAIGSMDGKKGYPDILYRQGKYYKFESKKKATLALWNQITDDNIDPNKGWNMVQYQLAVPEVFKALWANDPYRQVSKVYTAPHFVQTIKRIWEDKKEYTCDVYSLPIKSHTGVTMAETLYYYHYDDQDKLVLIEEYFKVNGKESRKSSMKILGITSNPADELFAMPQGCKVYGVGVGDMNDLLELPVEIESY